MMWLARLKPLAAVVAALVLATAGSPSRDSNSPHPREHTIRLRLPLPDSRRGRHCRPGLGSQPGHCQEAARPD